VRTDHGTTTFLVDIRLYHYFIQDSITATSTKGLVSTDVTVSRELMILDLVWRHCDLHQKPPLLAVPQIK